jgi:2'-deoxynucleoside 5'-phosphate N-hydrolase
MGILERMAGMKIYFAGSIRAGREDVHLYEDMVEYLRSFGEVLTCHVGDPLLSDKGDDGPDDRSIYDRDTGWLSICDFVVAEVSTPSLGVGFELGLAVSSNKPVLCLHWSGAARPLSAMIAGSPGIKTAGYETMDAAKKIIFEFISKTYDHNP